MEELHKILSASTLAGLYDAETAFLAANSGWEPVFKRYFLNDCALRPEAIRPEPGAVSHIGQAPLDGNGAAVWLYLVRGAKVQRTPGLTVVEADGRRGGRPAALLDRRRHRRGPRFLCPDGAHPARLY